MANLVANRSFEALIDGRLEQIRAGITRVDEDHEIAKRHPDAFDTESASRWLKRLANDPARQERVGDNMAPGGGTATTRTTGNEHRDGAMRAIERHVNSGELRAEAADRLDNVLRTGDHGGLTARWLEAVADEHYFTAFGAILQDPMTGHLRHTPEEQRAFQRVMRVQAEERSLNVTTGSSGSFAIPFALDPSILMSSSGATNPIRDVARVLTIGTGTWKGVSSDGVTAAFSAESAEASDGTPTLAQPTITAQKWNCFVPFTIEAEGDWPSLAQEMTRLIVDAKDVLEATAFLTGSGTNEPFGVLTGATTTVATGSSGAFVAADSWTLKAAIPPRFLPNTTFAAAPATWDTIYRQVAAADATNARQMESREGPFLGRPKIEWSTMSTATTTSGQKVLVGGDFAAAYTIVDRIGTTAEIVQHLVGSNHRPTGERGLYVYGRTGGKVVVPNALRTLVIK